MMLNTENSAAPGAEEMPFGFVTYLPDGSLDGSYYQIPSPDQRTRMIAVPDEIMRWNWLNYRANADRTALEPIPYVAPVPTRRQYTDAVTFLLDGEAQGRNYDNMLSACTYALSTVPKFKAEGEACVRWRDAVWVKCYDMLAQFNAGEIEQPTVPDLIAMMPAMEWPVDDDSETPVQS